MDAQRAELAPERLLGAEARDVHGQRGLPRRGLARGGLVDFGQREHGARHGPRSSASAERHHDKKRFHAKKDSAADARFPASNVWRPHLRGIILSRRSRCALFTWLGLP
mgnify:FL=1